jgi:uncharacterized protein (TIGR01777 family)
MRIFFTGGTGFIGGALVAALRARGDEPVIVTRDAKRAARRLGDAGEIIEADPTEAGPWQDRLAGCGAVINLAGASIAGRRWNAQVRQILVDSRVDVTRNLVAAIGRLAPAARPRVLVSASGIDLYPFAMTAGETDDDDPAVSEAAAADDSFLARLCREWEREAAGARAHGVRVVTVRTGIVLAAGGGALPRMVLPFKLLVGGRVGSGRQWLSWLHRDDAVGIYLFAVDTTALAGPVNAVAPEAVRQAAFARELGRAVHRPCWLPVPGFALRLAVGGLAEYLLAGRRVVPTALTTAGYPFRHPTLAGTLAAIFAGE